jgi:predicted enzyme related to lactoylglutathione lyase
MSRIQLALNVEHLEESIQFYSELFGTQPAKVRSGYANFAIAEPPLKLVLMENPGHGGSINHLGVEVEDVETVDSEQARLVEHGIAVVEQRGTTCCYATQDKFWVQNAPNGEQWEIYTVQADSPTFDGAASGVLAGDRSTHGEASAVLAADRSTDSSTDTRVQAACCTPAASTTQAALTGSSGAPPSACC